MKRVKISTANSKLGAFIPSLNLPAGKTCTKNAPCFKGCYALKGPMALHQKTTYNDNLIAFVEDRDLFFNDIINYLTTGLITFKYFRWFSSGDIVNDDFLAGMCKVATACPNIKFLAFTKRFNIVNEYLKTNTLPKNLHIVFSAWSKEFKVDNPNNLPIAYVNFKDKSKNPDIPDLAIPCKGHCPECLACFSLEEGQSVYFDQH